MWMIMYLITTVILLIWIMSSPFYWTIRRVKHTLPWPILGNCFPLLTLGNLGMVQYLYNMFPREKYMGFHLFTRPALFIRDPELLNQIMISGFDHFTSHGFYINEERDPAGGNLICIHGQQWKEVRRKLSQYFTSAKVKMSFNSVDSTMAKMNRVIDDKIMKKQPIETIDILKNVAIELLYQSLFGIQADPFENENSLFRKFAEDLARPSFSARVVLGMVSPKLYDLFKINIIREKFNKFTRELVLNVMDYRRKENVQRQDFLQGMMELMEGNRHAGVEYFPDNTRVPRYALKEIVGHTFAFNSAGIDTISLTCSYCLYELALHPDMQEKCRNEILSVIQEKGLDNITADNATSLPYLNAVVKEILRLYWLFPILGRECTKDYKVPGDNFTIEKGTLLILSTKLIYTDEKYFSEPHSFLPERFLSEENAIKGESFFPFGVGPRNCVGLHFSRIQVNLILSRLLQRYQFSVCGKTSIPLKYSKFSVLITPVDGMWLDVQSLQELKESNTS